MTTAQKKANLHRVFDLMLIGRDYMKEIDLSGEDSIRGKGYKDALAEIEKEFAELTRA